MAGISDQALAFGKINKYRFQGQEQQSKEFSDGSGLEMYEFKYRFDDDQIGRFWSVDPLANKYVYNSPYAFSEDKVTGDVELEGLEAWGINQTSAATMASTTNPSLYTDKEVKQIAAGEAKGQSEAAVAATPLLATVMTGGFAGIEAASVAALTFLTGAPVTPSPQAMAGPVMEDVSAAVQSTEGASQETVTLYRGVNESHVGYEDATNGNATPQGGNATPAEHNEGNTKSQYTSWTTDPDVAVNYAIRPNGGGAVLKMTVAQDATVVSPSAKDVLLKQSGVIKNESEVLLKGPVTGAKSTLISPDNVIYHP